MAVMTRNIDVAFELAPGKKEQFLKETDFPKSSDRALARACKYASKS